MKKEEFYKMIPVLFAILGGIGILATNKANSAKTKTLGTNATINAPTTNIALLRKKQFLTKAEMLIIIKQVKRDYPATAVILDKTVLAVCHNEAGGILLGKRGYNNLAFRNGVYPDRSIGICQLITPTAQGLKRNHPALPALTNYDSVKMVYMCFTDPYISLCYGMTLLTDNFNSLKSQQAHNKTIKDPLAEAVRAYNTGTAGRFSAAGNRYYAKYLGSLKIVDTMA